MVKSIKLLKSLYHIAHRKGFWPQSTYFPRDETGLVCAYSAGAYTATLLVKVNVIKGGGPAPPTLTSQGKFYPHDWMYARKLQLCVLCGSDELFVDWKFLLLLFVEAVPYRGWAGGPHGHQLPGLLPSLSGRVFRPRSFFCLANSATYRNLMYNECWSFSI